jgi:MFS family permease
LAMFQAFVLAALTLSGIVAVWHIILLSLMLGLINSCDIPIRQSFVVEMLETRDDLPNAIALNSFLVNAARLAGPSLAGILIAAFGEGVCFILNGVTFLAVIAALLAMQVRPVLNQARNARILLHLREGFTYAFGVGPIRSILLLLAAFSLLGMPYAVLMPVFAKDILHGGPETLGFLMAASGLGALAGAVFLASRRSVQGLERVMAVALALFGSAIIAFACSRTLWLSLTLLVVSGLGAMIQLVASNTLLQTIVDDDKRGRVMSFYTMCFMGMGPFGSLLAGGLASRFGAPWTLIIGGTGVVLAAALFSTRLEVVAGALRTTAGPPSPPVEPQPFPVNPPEGG